MIKMSKIIIFGTCVFLSSCTPTFTILHTLGEIPDVEESASNEPPVSDTTTIIIPAAPL
jgi:hypothetical protein